MDEGYVNCLKLFECQFPPFSTTSQMSTCIWKYGCAAWMPPYNITSWMLLYLATDVGTTYVRHLKHSTPYKNISENHMSYAALHEAYYTFVWDWHRLPVFFDFNLVFSTDVRAWCSWETLLTPPWLEWFTRSGAPQDMTSLAAKQGSAGRLWC